MEYQLVLDGEIHKVSLEFKEGRYVFDFGNKKLEVLSESVDPNTFILVIDGKTYPVYIAFDQKKIHLWVEGEKYEIQEAESVKEKKFEREGIDVEGKKSICAPMPGKILKILVKEGDKVRKNQSLAIVEAMKMEHEIKASIVGFVKKINFKEDDLVDTQEPILELEVETEEQKE